MTLSQLVLSIFIVFIIFRTYIAYKKKNLSESFFIIWILFWLGGLFLIFQQQLVIDIAHRIGISRGVDLVIYISLIAIFYILYRLMAWFYELDRKITELVRKIALRNTKKL